MIHGRINRATSFLLALTALGLFFAAAIPLRRSLSKRHVPLLDAVPPRGEQEHRVRGAPLDRERGRPRHLQRTWVAAWPRTGFPERLDHRTPNRRLQLRGCRIHRERRHQHDHSHGRHEHQLFRRRRECRGHVHEHLIGGRKGRDALHGDHHAFERRRPLHLRGIIPSSWTLPQREDWRHLRHTNPSRDLQRELDSRRFRRKQQGRHGVAADGAPRNLRLSLHDLSLEQRGNGHIVLRPVDDLRRCRDRDLLGLGAPGRPLRGLGHWHCERDPHGGRNLHGFRKRVGLAAYDLHHFEHGHRPLDLQRVLLGFLWHPNRPRQRGYDRVPPILIAAVNGTSVTYSAVGLPSGISYNTSSGELTGTAVEVGEFPVVFTATDSGELPDDSTGH